MELVSCQPPDDFLLPGVLRTNVGTIKRKHGNQYDMESMYSSIKTMGRFCYEQNLPILLPMRFSE
ncbi:hypothetical protein [Brotaphodocola sp.]|uniref:hypothetical protein n=1 Tax=Brotaphodocola sp. TaxID=3073577 RepID=UPI003D7EDCCC